MSALPLSLLSLNNICRKIFQDWTIKQHYFYFLLKVNTPTILFVHDYCNIIVVVVIITDKRI